MRLGICTTDFATMGADALFRQIGEMGFESVQFSFASIVESGYEARGDWEIPPAIAPETVRLVRGCARRYGLEIVAVNGTYNMAHPDAEVRQEGARRFAVLAQAAAELGAGMVSLCTGTRNRDSLWQVSPENDSTQAWHDMLEGVEQLLPQASALGLALGVEVEASNVVNTARRARDLLDACGSDALKIILDCANLFHAGKAHPRFVRETIGEAFALLGGDIALAHGKDIRESEGIDFCPAGEGIVDFPFFLQNLARAGYRGDMVLHGAYEEGAIRKSAAFLRGQIAAAGSTRA
ncbi:MAG TPA: sugar phosphate isomerase/epimerase [Candidatus Alectryocaccomicrobium excrementavium]|uniref:Sugar phosphate isomerase/epimerase n=1 Tax=Candidatus Alectryocaccomicrobium excrementavium TaxID=2840668 RepID=A0A9D1K7D0_9FIRM|nr:sugar phosphate isomerase/epimerase [Candidatus Alectryocaccomicrobium excrementavium]